MKFFKLGIVETIIYKAFCRITAWLPLLGMIYQCHAQTKSDIWILNEIVKDRPVGSEILAFRKDSGPLFDPLENPVKRPPSHTNSDILILTNEGLFFPIDGTGMLYRYNGGSGGKSPLFTRVDSTTGSGYNFAAKGFQHHDTIFSLGGYGYWHYQWTLRYYSPVSRGWELIPLNKKIHVSKQLVGNHLDSKNNTFYFSSRDTTIDEGLILPAGKKASEITHYALDLNSKKWKTLGVQTKAMTTLYGKGTRCCTTPFGEGIITHSRDNFTLYFIDPGTNQVFEWKDRVRSFQIYNAHTLTLHEEKTITYFRDSILTFLLPKKKRLDFVIRPSDLRVLPIKVYEPLSGNSAAILPPPLVLLAIGEGVIILLFIGFLYGNRKQKDQKDSTATTQELFDSVEQRILLALYGSSGNSINTEELDNLLGTGSKSIDLKNKRRSMVIKSINRKFQQATGREDQLFHAVRMENDRRMVRYVLDLDNYRLIKERLPR